MDILTQKLSESLHKGRKEKNNKIIATDSQINSPARGFLFFSV
jgi:hypothetical protein